jgi:hypothetical protein
LINRRAPETQSSRFNIGMAMPVALVLVLLDITLVYHAAKTGRLQP